jgi:uncharacterized protein YkwD
LPPPRARLGVEALERRDCPVASATLYNGVLTVQGSEGDDHIFIGRSGDWISAAGQWFAASSVAQLVVTAGGGDDRVRDASGLSAVIYGGAGDDTILGGRGHDTIYGGQGEDRILGGRGWDTVWGGSGNDTIDGGPGRDTISYGSAYQTRDNSPIEEEIIRLVNNFRKVNSVPPLAVSGRLNAAADLHSRDMIAIGQSFGPLAAMQHLLHGTTRPHITDRLDAVGYDDWGRAFRYGENIAFGFTRAVDVFSAWINSPPHRQSILNKAFTQTGVSVRQDAWGNRYFTQDFGLLA